MKTPTFARAQNFFLTISFLIVFAISTRTPVDNDMWLHLRVGEEMWTTGKFIYADTYSYTRAGASWVIPYWLSDLGLYGAWKIGGFPAITFVVSLIAVLVMWIVFRQMEGSPYVRGLLIVLAMMAALSNWTPRPQILSYLLLALLDAFLNRHINTKRQPLWVLLIIFALWGNIHGGFIWGALLLAATVAGEVFNIVLNNEPKMSWAEVGNLSIWSILAVLAVSINPYGIALWKLPFYTVGVSKDIQEWLSPNFHEFGSHPALWLLFLLIFAVAFSGKRASFTDLFKSIGFAYMALIAQRGLGPFAIIIAPTISRHISAAMEGFASTPLLQKLLTRTSDPQLPTRASIWINTILNAGILLTFASGALYQVYAVSRPYIIDDKVPAQAVAWIKENHPDGPMYNSYNWGGYLIWELRDYPVYTDGRAEIYGTDIPDEWLEIAEGTDKGFAALNRRGIKLIFLEPHWTLIDKLPERGWTEYYRDSKIVVYGR